MLDFLHPSHLQLLIAGAYLIGFFAFLGGILGYFQFKRNLDVFRDEHVRLLRSAIGEESRLREAMGRELYVELLNKIADLGDIFEGHVFETNLFLQQRRPRRKTKRKRQARYLKPRRKK